MLSILISIIAFLVAVSFLVTFHELGHFWVARKLKVTVLRFSVGFGKVIWRKYGRDGVEYCISAIPLGGYVKMLDEREGPVDDDKLDNAFNRQHVLKRILIVLAGPVANFILAIALFFLVLKIGITGIAPIISEVDPDTPAYYAGLQVNDQIQAINHQPTPILKSVQRELVQNIDQSKVSITLIRGKETVETTLALPALSKDETFDMFDSLGIDFNLPARIGDVEEDSPAARAGLKKGDQIIGFDDTSVPHWTELIEYVSTRANEPVNVKYMRDGQTMNVDLTIAEKLDGTGYLGVYLGEGLIGKEQLPFGEALLQAAKQVGHYSLLTLKLMYYMVSGKISWDNISGPVTIAHVAGMSAQGGLVYFLDFLAIISISLGVINLLPIPMLDGGHLLYYLVELVTGKPVSEKVQGVGLRIGFMIIVSLMVIAIYNDLLRLI